MIRRPPRSPLFPYTTRLRSGLRRHGLVGGHADGRGHADGSGGGHADHRPQLLTLSIQPDSDLPWSRLVELQEYLSEQWGGAQQRRDANVATALWLRNRLPAR